MGDIDSLKEAVSQYEEQVNIFHCKHYNLN